MKQGNLILVRNYDPVSKIIRKVLKCEYNHVGYFIEDEVIVEANFKGVEKVNYSNYFNRKLNKKVDYDIYRIQNITEDQIKIMSEFISSKIGQKYDIVQFISIFLMLVLHITRRVEPIELGSRWICSELIAEGAYKAGIEFKEDVDPDNTTPYDIFSSDIIEKVQY